MQQTPATRKSWLIIFGALCLAVLTYGLLVYFVSADPRRVAPTLPTLKPFLIVAAVGALVASCAWLFFTTNGKIGGEGRPVSMSPADFQTQSIVALALSEACSIMGLLAFFLGAPPRQFWIFALGTFAVNLLYILPRGLAFWNNLEGSPRDDAASSGPFS